MERSGFMGERIGWIGLSELDYPMAVNLLESGYQLSVYNRTRSKAGRSLREGLAIAESAGVDGWLR